MLFLHVQDLYYHFPSQNVRDAVKTINSHAGPISEKPAQSIHWEPISETRH